ncbi:MAG: hypothetical protein Q8P50_02840 [Bacillota bacterium]|nr:hypothetical protein [Bacillota bacterium]
MSGLTKRFLAIVTLVGLILSTVPIPAVAGGSVQYSTLGWDANGSWSEGNLGDWPEDSFISNQVLILNNSDTDFTLSEIDITYSFWDDPKNAIGIDYARNFYISTSTYFAKDGTSRTIDPLKWKLIEPSKRNLPWTTNIGEVISNEDQNNPYKEHYWGILPGDLGPAKTIPPGGSLAIYFEAHLAVTFVWKNGIENQLPINGYEGTTVRVQRAGPSG